MCTYNCGRHPTPKDIEFSISEPPSKDKNSVALCVHADVTDYGHIHFVAATKNGSDYVKIVSFRKELVHFCQSSLIL